MDDKTIVTVDADYAIANLILEQARWQSKCVVAGTSAVEMKITPQSLADAADLVFLTLSLISERKK